MADKHTGGRAAAPIDDVQVIHDLLITLGPAPEGSCPPLSPEFSGGQAAWEMYNSIFHALQVLPKRNGKPYAPFVLRWLRAKGLPYDGSISFMWNMQRWGIVQPLTVREDGESLLIYEADEWDCPDELKGALKAENERGRELLRQDAGLIREQIIAQRPVKKKNTRRRHRTPKWDSTRRP